MYFIRSCFWAVFLIGSIDVIIAFLRVEEISDMIFNDNLVRALKKPSFVCTFIHIPLVFISFIIGYFSKTLGFTWLALMIVCKSIVITRSFFLMNNLLWVIWLDIGMLHFSCLPLPILYLKMVMLE